MIAPVDWGFVGRLLAQAIVAAAVAAPVGHFFAMRKFRSEQSFNRKSEWLEELSISCALLNQAVSAVIRAVQRSNDLPSEDDGRTRDNIAVINTTIDRVRLSLAQTFLYADDDLFRDCHVLDEVLDEYDPNMAPSLSTLVRIEAASIPAGRAAAKRFRLQHKWDERLAASPKYADRLHTDYQMLVQEADARTDFIIRRLNEGTSS